MRSFKDYLCAVNEADTIISLGKPFIAARLMKRVSSSGRLDEMNRVVRLSAMLFSMLKGVLVAAALVFTSMSAHGQRSPQPIPRGPNEQCPSGYFSSGGYCKPFDEKSKYAVPREGKMQCPAGYYASGNACLAFDSKSRNAIPRVGQCPSGYYSSGDYCVEFQ
jgi:hypothetical protein